MRYVLSYLHSSFPFSFPRSFLSFLGFLSRASSAIDTRDVELCVKDVPEGPAAGAEVSAVGGIGGRELEQGVGNSSPSDTVWYCNKDLNKNLEKIKESNAISMSLGDYLQKIKYKTLLSILTCAPLLL